MKVVMDRGLCDASLSFCQRCSAAFLRDPEGTDRLCIMEVVDDGKESLTLEVLSDGRVLEVELSDEDRDIAAVEGWESLADFDPALFRDGAAQRWQEIRLLPASH